MAESIIAWEPIAIAFVGGIFPALLWLWVWLKQDKKSPEPKGLIAISFFAGMGVVLFVLPFEKLAVTTLPAFMDMLHGLSNYIPFVVFPDETVRIMLWAFIEESAKYLAVLFVAFQSKHFDEPIDAVIYLITAALGFAALENSFYLFKSLHEASIWNIALDGNLRFIGATVLHITSSAFLGVALAFSFYSGRFVKIMAGFLGLAFATLLHAYFNLSIMEVEDTISALVVFSRFWLMVVGIIVLLSIIKLIKPEKEIL